MDYLKIIDLMSDIKSANLVEYSSPYYLVVVLYSLFYISCERWKNPFIMAWVIYGLLPLLDYFLPIDDQNPTKQQRKMINKKFRFKLPLIIGLLTEWILLVWTIHHVMTNNEGLVYNIGAILIIATFEGTSLTISHELCHKTVFWERLLGGLNLLKNFYLHFIIEHTESHHRIVATPDDPSTALKNETVYQYIPKGSLKAYLVAFEIENEKFSSKGQSIFNINNRMMWFTLAYILFPVAIYSLFGLKVMLLQLATGLGGMIFLQFTGYIEHYGLLRKKGEDGKYENTTLLHSWNAPHRISNYLLFKLQRHSDHHENALQPYQSLASYEESPTLPNGYSICIMLALIPPVWFKIMNPLIDSLEKHSKIDKQEYEKTKKMVMGSIYTNNVILLSIVLMKAYMI
jgi:alkane 1-monooxygenase